MDKKINYPIKLREKKKHPRIESGCHKITALLIQY
jgi:hypothetical protein